MPNNGVYLCIQRPCCQRDHRILFYTKCTFFRWHTAYMGTVPWPCHMSVIHQSHHLSYSHSYHSLMCYCSANWSNLLYTLCMQDHQHYLCNHTAPEMTKTNYCFPSNLKIICYHYYCDSGLNSCSNHNWTYFGRYLTQPLGWACEYIVNPSTSRHLLLPSTSCFCCLFHWPTKVKQIQYNWTIRFHQLCRIMCHKVLYLEYITLLHGDVKFLFSSWKNIEQVSATNEWNIFQHKKRNLISPSHHVIFLLLYKILAVQRFF